MLPNTIDHNSRTILNPQQWAETLKRKREQDDKERQLRWAKILGHPTLDMI